MTPMPNPRQAAHGDESNSEELLSFFAGKMIRDNATNKVTADCRKGVYTFSRGKPLDRALPTAYFILKWYEKDSTEVENSYILFPHAHEFRALNIGATSIYGLYRRVPVQGEQRDESTADTPALPLCIFWLQEDKDQFDSKLTAMNAYLRSADSCADAISAHELTVLHSLMKSKARPDGQRSQETKLPSIKSLLQDPKTIQLLNEKAAFYCRAVESTIPPELRRDPPLSGMGTDDFGSILQMYIHNKEMRECEDLLQECIDSAWSPPTVLRELCGKEKTDEMSGASYHNFVTTPSTLSLLKLLIDSKKCDDDVNENDDSRKSG